MVEYIKKRMVEEGFEAKELTGDDRRTSRDEEGLVLIDAEQMHGKVLSEQVGFYKHGELNLTISEITIMDIVMARVFNMGLEHGSVKDRLNNGEQITKVDLIAEHCFDIDVINNIFNEWAEKRKDAEGFEDLREDGKPGIYEDHKKAHELYKAKRATQH